MAVDGGGGGGTLETSGGGAGRPRWAWLGGASVPGIIDTRYHNYHFIFSV